MRPMLTTPLAAAVALGATWPAATLAAPGTAAPTVVAWSALGSEWLIDPGFALTVASLAAVAARATPVDLVTVARGALLDNGLEIAGGQQLEQPAAIVLLLRLNDRHDADSVDVLLGLDLQLVTDGRAVGKNGTVQCASWFASAGGTPGPGPV